jgi:hypothetical protein
MTTLLRLPFERSSLMAEWRKLERYGKAVD